MENLVLNFYTIIFFFISYFVGSIPFGYLIYKLKYNDDIRKHGSGNIGATNVNRLLGKKLGLLTLFFDFLKTFSICIIITHFYGSELGGVCGVFSILGHIFPVWLKFKGGKGVASFLGLLLVISWPLFVIFCSSWLISVKLFKFSAAGAITAILLNILIFKIFLTVQFTNNMLLWIPGTPYELYLVIFISIIILYKHYKNIIGFFKK